VISKSSLQLLIPECYEQMQSIFQWVALKHCSVKSCKSVQLVEDEIWTGRRSCKKNEASTSKIVRPYGLLIPFAVSCRWLFLKVMQMKRMEMVQVLSLEISLIPWKMPPMVSLLWHTQVTEPGMFKGCRSIYAYIVNYIVMLA